jgi:hypothetical protein
MIYTINELFQLENLYSIELDGKIIIKGKI